MLANGTSNSLANCWHDCTAMPVLIGYRLVYAIGIEVFFDFSCINV